MGDFSDPRDFTESDIKEILYDDYFSKGIPPFKALMQIYEDMNARRFDYKLQSWQFTYDELRRIVREIGIEQLNILASRAK
jgi:hypothetical protein